MEIFYEQIEREVYTDNEVKIWNKSVVKKEIKTRIQVVITAAIEDALTYLGFPARLVNEFMEFVEMEVPGPMGKVTALRMMFILKAKKDRAKALLDPRIESKIDEVLLPKIYDPNENHIHIHKDAFYVDDET